MTGWKTGLNKVRLTQTLRDGGMPLGEAVAITESVLAGRVVRVHLGQFASTQAAAEALTAIGICEVTA
jgi:hypothetical protein